MKTLEELQTEITCAASLASLLSEPLLEAGDVAQNTEIGEAVLALHFYLKRISSDMEQAQALA